jgi:threonyl-tRNA synthetase
VSYGAQATGSKFSEEVVEQVIKDLGIDYDIGEGEAVFYGTAPITGETSSSSIDPL